MESFEVKQRETERESESFTSQIIANMADTFETILREVEEELEYPLKVEQRKVFLIRAL